MNRQHQLTQIPLSDANTRTTVNISTLKQFSIERSIDRGQYSSNHVWSQFSIVRYQHSSNFWSYGINTQAIPTRQSIVISILKKFLVDSDSAKRRPTSYRDHENNTQGRRIVQTINRTEINTQAITITRTILKDTVSYKRSIVRRSILKQSRSINLYFIFWISNWSGWRGSFKQSRSRDQYSSIASGSVNFNTQAIAIMRIILKQSRSIILNLNFKLIRSTRK